MILRKKCVIIGGGPAGMTAATTLFDQGIRDILLIERENELGGILKQCIHNGFGLHKFGKELTGPEYADRYEKMVEERKIPYLLNTMVNGIEKKEDGTILVSGMNDRDGLFDIVSDTVILAMGCRERPRGAMNIPGTRPAGIYTAGAAQKYVNLMGLLPGKEVVVLGSGDIGLIMARRMTLEGSHVACVCELMPYSGGLQRNIEQCLNDFGIPLRLSTTITEIHGKDRLTGVTVMRVDEETKRPVPGTEEFIPCDTLLLSVGLLPENELTRKAGIGIDPVTKGAFVTEDRETDMPGVFACGNVLHVHDLVDHVSDEAEITARAVAKYLAIQGKADYAGDEFCLAMSGQKAHFEGKKPPLNWKEKALALAEAKKQEAELAKAGKKPDRKELICICCPKGCPITVRFETDGKTIRKISGNTCSRGLEYAKSETVRPVRTITSTMRTASGGLVACKTERPVPKSKMMEVMEEINRAKAPSEVKIGDVLLADAAGTGISVIATANTKEGMEGLHQNSR